ncbi:MAG: GNAT family N-acetyltransferase [Acidimicrobiia bacterium]
MEIRPARPEDVNGILEVLGAALGETALLKRTPELWAWKHVINPFGPSIVLLAWFGDRIAGVRALMRWDLLTVQGRQVRCVRPVDTSTHPDFERRGVFKTLTLEAVALARETGIDLIFNTPNRRSGAGYLSMGWREVGAIGVLARPRFGFRVGPDGQNAPSLEDVAPGALGFLPIQMPDRPPRGLRTPRTAEYQRWRFGSHPTVRYGTVADGDGAAVVRVGVRSGRTELVLSDLLGGAGHRAVSRAGAINRASYLAGFFSKGSPERSAAIRGGMLPVPVLKTLQLIALPLTDLDTDAFDLRSWDIATSDLELL